MLPKLRLQSQQQNVQRNLVRVGWGEISPAGSSLDIIEQDCHLDKNRFCFHAVTVPGTAKGYEDLIHRHESVNFTLLDLLEPAANLAEDGFPVTPITSHHWKLG